MKKLYYIILLLAATACSKDTIHEKLWDTCAEDAIQYPEPWTAEVSKTFVIPDKTIRRMSTCGLLEAYLRCPDRGFDPWCIICSDLNVGGVARFNDMVNNDRVVVELFKRKDCIPVLMTKFQSVIVRHDGKEGRGKNACLEMLLASDLCMSVLNDANAQRSLMEMALEMASANETHIREVRHIMVAIMKKCNYTPFLEEAVKDHPSYTIGTYLPGLTEWMYGYIICRSDIVEKYAKKFLSEKK
ncbi:MAG: hypothetical protein LBS88_05535 [Tannerellaceae bacterium]|nr:hypothetical protein [Tannerellaceae bacterium]